MRIFVPKGEDGWRFVNWALQQGHLEEVTPRNDLATRTVGFGLSSLSEFIGSWVEKVLPDRPQQLKLKER